MSKGSKVVLVRFPKEELDAMLAQIASSNESRRDEPYTVSSFVRYCVQAQLKKNVRGRAPRPAGRKATGPANTSDESFDGIWSFLAEQGRVDFLGGAEYQRVRQEWEKAGRPNVQEFALRQANLTP